VFVYLLQQTKPFQIGHNLFTGVEAVHTDVFFRDQFAFFWLIVTYDRINGEDVNQSTMALFAYAYLVAMALPYVVVVEVMGRCDLDAAGSKLRVHVLFISDDGDLAPGEG